MDPLEPEPIPSWAVPPRRMVRKLICSGSSQPSSASLDDRSISLLCFDENRIIGQEYSSNRNMLAGIDALIALERYGTVSEAAVRLRLTQSAVSKRIKALTDTLGFDLVEPDGRRIRLTSQAVTFLERARPLVAELRGLRTPAQSGSMSNFSLALADSIASSWGPQVVRQALESLRGVAVDLHAHRSVLVIEYVRLGRYHIGLCTDPLAAKDLIGPDACRGSAKVCGAVAADIDRTDLGGLESDPTADQATPSATAPTPSRLRGVVQRGHADGGGRVRGRPDSTRVDSGEGASSALL
ncbi:MAG: LysR family transcriptional regulator [Betaproteobacteria bacterium]|nr:MAG: LysR family transcriptional regulator [Betaproteobacteria bacterium]